MITTSPISGKEVVSLPIRRAVALFTNRAGNPESVTLNIPSTNDESEAVFSVKSAIADLLHTEPASIRIGDKQAETYPVFIAPAEDASATFTLE
jgi:hypothetical protein